MNERALIPVSNFDPWSRAIARTVTTIEEAAQTTPLLLHVFDEETKHMATKTADLNESDTLDTLAESRSGVRAAGSVLADAGFDYEVHGVECENLGQAILEATTDETVDRLYMYSRRRSPAGKAVFGSTIGYVLSNATVPVVVLPSNATTGERE